MIRQFRTAAIAASLAISAPAFAADLMGDVVAPPAADAPSRFYATVFAGASQPYAKVSAFVDPPFFVTVDSDFEVGYIIGGAIGAKVLPNLRGEVEFSVVNSEISSFYDTPLPDGVTMNSTGYNLLGNLWYDVDTGSAFTPYIGGGIGYGYGVITQTDVDEDINTSGWLYQFGAGVRYAATDVIALDLAYRYRVQPDAEVTSDTIPEGFVTSSATNHIVTAGVSVGF